MPVQEGTAPDGSGSLNQVKVTKEGRALSKALSETDQQHAVAEGGGFTFHSIDAGAQAGEESWYVQNNGEDIRVERIKVNTSVAGVFSVMLQTSTTAASGTEMFGRNMIAGRDVMSDITAFGNDEVAGSLDGTEVDSDLILANTAHWFILDGYILPKGKALFVRTATTGAVRITGVVHRD